MSTTIVWTPATAPTVSPVTFATGGLTVPVRIIDVPEGLNPVTVSPVTSKGAGQPGETGLDAMIPPRVIVVQARLQATNWDDFEDLRSDIARAFAQSPVRFGGELTLGLLSYTRGSVEREIDALPVSAAIARDKPGIGIGKLDAEWMAPYPYWRDIADSTDTIAHDDSEILANTGDVDAPILARLWGPATEVVLTNAATGESFTITPSSALLSTDYLEIDTTPGVKSITRVDDLTDARVNAMAGLDLSDARLWSLRPGNSSVSFAATGDSGATHAEIFWRNRYSGV